jgi:hypothetical protein
MITTGAVLYEYSFGTPWNVATLVYTGVFKDSGTGQSSINQFQVKEDGYKAFSVSGFAGQNGLDQYNFGG